MINTDNKPDSGIYAVHDKQSGKLQFIEIYRDKDGKQQIKIHGVVDAPKPNLFRRILNLIKKIYGKRKKQNS